MRIIHVIWGDFMKKLYCAVVAAVMCISSTLCAQNTVTNIFKITPYQTSVSSFQAMAYLQQYTRDVSNGISLVDMNKMIQDLYTAIKGGKNTGFADVRAVYEKLHKSKRFGTDLTRALLSFFTAYSHRLQKLIDQKLFSGESVGKIDKKNAWQSATKLSATMQEAAGPIQNNSDSRVVSRVPLFQREKEHWSSMAAELKKSNISPVDSAWSRTYHQDLSENGWVSVNGG